MKRLYRLYEASPAAAFAEIEEDLAQLEKRLATISEAAAALHGLVESTLRTISTPAVAVPAPTRWTFDVRLPNLYFDNVYDPELTETGAKMWVRRSGLLRTRLALPRVVQYDFSISVVDFAVPEWRQTFRLSVDGRVYPWLSVESGIFSTIILEAPEADALEFELSVASDVLPADDVSFSFSGIEIRRRLN
jgi:hypothetical protein